MTDLIQRIRTAPDSEVFMHIMELSSQGPAAEPAAMMLIEDGDALVRSRGYCVLENIDGAVARHQAALLKQLDDIEMRNCKDLTKSLIYNDVPRDSIFRRCEELANSARTEELAACAYVAVSLAEVDAEYLDRCVSFVRAVCRHRDVVVRRHGFQALEEGLKVREKLVAEIIEGIADSDPAIRVLAANHAGQVGAKAKAAVPALIDALSEHDADLRCGAAWSLGHMGSAGRAAIDSLAVALRDPDESVRINAAESLGSFGKHAHTAIPTMIDVLPEDSLVTDLLIVTVWKLIPDKKQLLDPLITLLKDGPENLKPLAAEYLGKLGNAATAAIPALESALNESMMGLDYVAKAALKKIARATKGQAN